MDTEIITEPNNDRTDEETEDTSCLRCFPKALCNPNYALHRYFVLIFMCFLGFGSYYCYDNPGSLQTQIETDMGISVSKFAQLYAWYSWPNVVLCFFGGFLIDRIMGIRLGAIVFAGIIFIGQLVFATGALVNMYWLMVFGRFIFGIGGESLAVAQNTYAVSWFKNKELNMVFGLQLSIARAGSTANFMTMTKVYEKVHEHFKGYTCLGVTLMLAAITCLFSLFCAFVLAYFDKRAARILRKESTRASEVVNITDVKNFGLPFWLISFICITYYVAIFPFTGLGSTFFQRKYDISQDKANFDDSIIYLISAGASPVFGLIVDYFGRNISWVILAAIITLASHAMLAFTFIQPLAAMVIMGFGYSLLACALWPMVALVIPEHQLGTAYGIMQSLQNLGLGCVVLIAGYIADSYGYIVLEIFFFTWLCSCLIFLMLLYINDLRTGGKLNMSVKQRLQLEIHSKAKEEDIFSSSASTSSITDKKDM